MEEIYWDSATHQAVQLKQLSLCLAEILQQHLVRHLLLPLQAHPLLPLESPLLGGEATVGAPTWFGIEVRIV